MNGGNLLVLIVASAVLLTALATFAEGADKKESGEELYVGDLFGRDTLLYFVEVNNRLHPYRVYFPQSYQYVQEPKSPDFKPFPLVVVCHSSGADEVAYFGWKGHTDRIQTIAEERGYVVACPGAPGRHWHNEPKTEDPEVIIKKGGLCKEEGIAVIMEVIREVTKQFWIDKDRVYATGASSGAIAVYGAASRYPETFAGVAGVCGGFTDNMIEGLAKVPVLMFNAQKDKTFKIDRIREQKEKLEAAGGEVKLHEVPTGHGGYRDLKSYAVLFDWFDAQRGAPEK